MGKVFQRKDRNIKDWYISYYEDDGTRVKKRIGPSKKLAEVALQKIEVEKAEGRYLNVKSRNKIKFEEFADQYLKFYASNLKSYRKSHQIRMRVLLRFFEGRYLDDISVLDIEKMKTQRSEEVSVATVNRELACLKSVFNKAISWDQHHGDNPVRKVKFFRENNQRLRYLEKEELIKLIDASSGHLKMMIILAANTGMRLGEILGLKWEDIDFKHDIIYLLETKNNEKREVPVNSEVKRTLLEYMKESKKGDYVFTGRFGSSLTTIRASFSTALKKCGINNLHFHDLRHTFASHLVMNGVDLNTVRELLGHKTIKMTLRYSHLSPDHKKRAVEMLGQGFRSKDGKGEKISVPRWSPSKKAQKFENSKFSICH